MPQKIRILYAGDSAADAEPALRELGRQGLEHDCVALSDLGEIAAALEKDPFDVLLSAPSLKKFNAKELLEQRNRLFPELPFIVIAGALPGEQAAELLGLGATACVPGDKLAGLPGAISLALVRGRLGAGEREARGRQAQKMEAVGRLAGGIAHDFNNMLGAIEGYATLGLRRLDEADPLWADLSDIRKAVARASALTKQLLVFSRKHALKKEPVGPDAVLEKLQGVFKRLLGESVSVKLEVEPGLPKIPADQGQLEQLLLNLVLNARDAMPGGGVVTVRAGLARLEPQKVLAPNPAAAGTDFVKISVADTGTGMPAAVVEHLFEPFFTTKEKGKGTGLGLSTAYGIASQHNGWLEVRTGEGKGSEFSLFLPVGPRPIGTA